MTTKYDTEGFTEDDINIAMIVDYVRMGFYSPDEVREMMKGDGDELFLENAILDEFGKKAAEEESWPDETDCDRLDQAFDTLNANGIIAIQYAGCDMADGLMMVESASHDPKRRKSIGYCFYHSQDLFNTVNGDDLYLAFGGLEGHETACCEIANLIVSVLTFQGFRVDWNGNPGTRIHIHTIDWKRRGPK